MFLVRCYLLTAVTLNISITASSQVHVSVQTWCSLGHLTSSSSVQSTQSCAAFRVPAVGQLCYQAWTTRGYGSSALRHSDKERSSCCQRLGNHLTGNWMHWYASILKCSSKDLTGIWPKHTLSFFMVWSNSFNYSFESLFNIRNALLY